MHGCKAFSCSQVDDLKCGKKWSFLFPNSGFSPILSPSLVMHYKRSHAGAYLQSYSQKVVIRTTITITLARITMIITVIIVMNNNHNNSVNNNSDNIYIPAPGLPRVRFAIFSKGDVMTMMLICWYLQHF